MKSPAIDEPEETGTNMKAAVFLGNEQIEMQDVPIPEPPKGEVLIKVCGCGVCGTDVHLYEGIGMGVKPPVAFGHEISGIVAGCGKGVTDLQEGQHVAIDPVVACGYCRYCQLGRTNLCNNPTIIGYARWGGFAEYCLAPRSHVYRVADDVSVQAGILIETLACVINGYERLAIEPGSSVLVIGAGSVGLLWNNLIKHTCITQLIQVDLVPQRVEKARLVGADAAHLVGTADAEDEFNRIYTEGFDVAIDCSGTAKGVRFGLEHVRKGGKFMVFGVCGEDERVTISPFEIFNKELSIIGAKMPPRTLEKSVRLIEAGIISVDEIVTNTYPLESLVDCIHRFAESRDQEVKMMIDPAL